MFFELLISIAIFSVIPIVVKYTSANPYTIGLFRLLVASFLLGLFWRKKIDWSAFSKKTFWKLLIIGVCFFLHWITYTFSIKIGGASVCVLGMATYGVQLIFYGAFFLGYHVSKKNIFCLCLILGGIGLVIPGLNFHNDTTIGLGLALVSASFYALIPIMLQKSHEFNQETRIFFQFFIALICFTFISEKTQWSSLSHVDWWALWFLAVVGTFIAHTLWSKCVSTMPTTTTGIVYYMITPTAMILSAIVLGEKLSFKQQFGGGVILAAALINSFKFNRFKKPSV